ncbi:MAG: long-chain fatty acid--CoA ligase [Gemmatimonadales bacterium]
MPQRPWHAAYDPGVPAALDYEDLTIPDVLDRSARLYAESPALIFHNCTLTYAQFKSEVDRLATAMAALGVRKDSRVAIQLPNLPQTAIAYYATLRLGAQAVMTNPLYTATEIVHQWTDAGVMVAVVLDSLFKYRIEPVIDKLPVKQYIAASIPDYLHFPLNFLARLKLKRQDPPMVARVEPTERVRLFRKTIQSVAPNPPVVDIAMDDVAMLQYTGGTTGVSKGAMLTHRNISYNLQQIARWNPNAVMGKEVLLACLPYFHIYGLTVSMNMPVYLGAAMILVPNPRDIAGMLKSIRKFRVTMFPAVPAIYSGINQQRGVEELDLSSIGVCNSGSAPLPVDVLERFEKLTGGRITEGYGLTETSPVTHSNPLMKRKVGSIGVPLPDTDAKIVDLENGTDEMPTGKEGELILQGPQIMKGYWNRPDETAQMIVDGWLHTGDIAVQDEEGYFYIVGRKKDMILCSGYNVYPDEVDRVLMGHPAVLEAATIGIPDEKRGETVKSFVVLKPGGTATERDLVEHCREQLAAYKVPRLIEFRESLPKSTVLKILRRELREQELAKRGP